MKHREIKWNPVKQEWFCVVCGRTSDHKTEQDAQREIEQFECIPPSDDPLYSPARWSNPV
jgi:hypothetical protein